MAIISPHLFSKKGILSFVWAYAQIYFCLDQLQQYLILNYEFGRTRKMWIITRRYKLEDIYFRSIFAHTQYCKIYWPLLISWTINLKCGSPGLAVKGWDSWSEGCEFESQHRILDGHFSTLICYKICIVCFKKAWDKRKWSRMAHFLMQ